MQIKSTKAAILVQSREALVVDEIFMPDSLDYGQVLVKILYTGICGSQLGEIDAKKGPDRFLPHLLGHEASATVIQCGPGVKHVAEGDLVVLHWRKGLGIESAPPIYKWRGKKCNAGWVATFAQHAVVSENRMTKVPQGSPTELLPLMGCAVTTGLGVINNNAHVRLGESVVIYGAGGVGLNVVQGAALSGAYPIIAVDLYDNRLELAATLGATHTINANSCDAAKRVASILCELGQPQGADVCIENTGQTQCIEACYKLAHAKGRVVCVGVPDSLDGARIYTLPLHFGKSITGSHGGESTPNEDIPRYLRLYSAGKLPLEQFITERFRLEDINVAISRMRSGQSVGRCVIAC